MSEKMIIECPFQQLVITPKKVLITHKIGGKSVELHINKISGMVLHSAGTLTNGYLEFACDGLKEKVSFTQYEELQLHTARSLINLYQSGDYDEENVLNLIRSQKKNKVLGDEKRKQHWIVGGIVTVFIIGYFAYLAFSPSDYEYKYDPSRPATQFDPYDYNFDGKVDEKDVEEFVEWKEKNRKE